MRVDGSRRAQVNRVKRETYGNSEVGAHEVANRHGRIQCGFLCSSVPFDFDVHALLFSENAPALEAQLHRHFLERQVNKVNPRKEFFHVALAHIRHEIERLGLSTGWTMTAEATQYRQSLAIAKALNENMGFRESWTRQQQEFDLLDIDMETIKGALIEADSVRAVE